MTEVKVQVGLTKAVSLLEQFVGARRYWIHNRVGGDNWEALDLSDGTLIKIRDPRMLTYFLLKLK